MERRRFFLYIISMAFAGGGLMRGQRLCARMYAAPSKRLDFDVIAQPGPWAG